MSIIGLIIFEVELILLFEKEVTDLTKFVLDYTIRPSKGIRKAT